MGQGYAVSVKTNKQTNKHDPVIGLHKSNIRTQLKVDWCDFINSIS
jgi:hypothetical protein